MGKIVARLGVAVLVGFVSAASAVPQGSSVTSAVPAAVSPSFALCVISC